MISIQLSLVFFEPPSFADWHLPIYEEKKHLILLAEWSLMAFWLFDLYLRIYRTSWNLFFRRTKYWCGKKSFLEKKHLALTIMYLLNLLDLFLFSVTGGKTFRFYRFLRPMLIVIHFEGIQQLFRIFFYCTMQ